MNITRKIVNFAHLDENTYVLEIGPGPGGLTLAILEKQPRRLVTIEKDERCLPGLEELILTGSIMGNWPTTAPIGLVWTYGGWSDLSWYDYLTDIGVDDMMSKNLCDNWRCARSFTLLVYRSFDPRGRSRLMPRGILSCFIFELK